MVGRATFTTVASMPTRPDPRTAASSTHLPGVEPNSTLPAVSGAGRDAITVQPRSTLLVAGRNEHQLVGVAPRPGLAGFHRPDQWVRVGVPVGRCVPPGRVVAAADVAARQALAKVDPPQAFAYAVPAGG